MRKRIGKDLVTRWAVTTGGEALPLAGRDLTLVIKHGTYNKEYHPQFIIEGTNTIVFTWYGTEQEVLGEYLLTLWENKGGVQQTVVDTPFVELVARTFNEDESGCDCGCECCCDLETETIDLETSDLDISGRGLPAGGTKGQMLVKKSDTDYDTEWADQIKHPYLSLERLRPYLYKVTFDSLPEDNGGELPISGGCSSFVRYGKLYRNLDFNYDNAASFIVRTRDFEGMSFVTGLNDGQMDDSLIAQLPYRVVDGRNNNGIIVSTHVLFNDWEWTGAGNRSVTLTRLPFEVLTRVKSMATISADLDGILGNLYASAGLLATEYLLQVLVTDGTTTYALLPPTSEGQGYVLQDITSNPKLANFRWVSRSEVARTDSDIQDRPTGIERWNMMPCELSELRFTKAYETPTRLSEFIGIRETTKYSTDAELEAIYDDARAIYLDRERDWQTWQTMHSVVYGSKMEQLYIQENWSDNCVSGGSSADVDYFRIIDGKLNIIYEDGTDN